MGLVVEGAWLRLAICLVQMDKIVLLQCCSWEHSTPFVLGSNDTSSAPSARDYAFSVFFYWGDDDDDDVMERG